MGQFGFPHSRFSIPACGLMLPRQSAQWKIDPQLPVGIASGILPQTPPDLMSFHPDEGILAWLKAVAFAKNGVSNVSFRDLPCAPFDRFDDDIAKEILTTIAGGKTGEARTELV